MPFFSDKVSDEIKFFKIIKSDKVEEAHYLYMMKYVDQCLLDMQLYGYLTIRSIRVVNNGEYRDERIDFTARKILVEKFSTIGDFKTFFETNNSPSKKSLDEWMKLGIPYAYIFSIIAIINYHDKKIENERQISAIDALIEKLKK